jgi:hypothetical protein
MSVWHCTVDSDTSTCIHHCTRLKCRCHMKYWIHYKCSDLCSNERTDRAVR